MIDRSKPLSVNRQAQLLNISRGAVYYLPKPVAELDLTLMNAIDKLNLDYPFMGSRQLRRALCHQGHQVGRLHARTLMYEVGISVLTQQFLHSLSSNTKCFVICFANWRSIEAIRSVRWIRPIFT